MSKPRGRWGERCPARQGASRAQRTPLAAGAPVVSRPISPVAEVAEVGEVGDVGGGVQWPGRRGAAD
ncbi:MAG: hypothetical protein ACXV5Q_05060 [Frankiaceae bacterium]